jgi:hypothetical protein
MEQNGLAYDMVSKEDVLRLKAQLQAVPVFTQQPGYGSATAVDVTRTQFFRIPFTQALDLVAHRQVFLENGYAYVPVERLVSIIVARFRSNLSRGLLDAFSSYPYILADTRIAPMVANMSKQYTGKDFTQTKSSDAVNIDDLDMLADRSMSLCMRVLHKNLRQVRTYIHTHRERETDRQRHKRICPPLFSLLPSSFLTSILSYTHTHTHTHTGTQAEALGKVAVWVVFERGRVIVGGRAAVLGAGIYEDHDDGCV